MNVWLQKKHFMAEWVILKCSYHWNRLGLWLDSCDCVSFTFCVLPSVLLQIVSHLSSSMCPSAFPICWSGLFCIEPVRESFWKCICSGGFWHSCCCMRLTLTPWSTPWSDIFSLKQPVSRTTLIYMPLTTRSCRCSSFHAHNLSVYSWDRPKISRGCFSGLVGVKINAWPRVSMYRSIVMWNGSWSLWWLQRAACPLPLLWP